MRLHLPHEASSGALAAEPRELLALRDVVKSWRSGSPLAPVVRSVLRGVSLSIAEGEVLALFADAEGGATTLLLIAAGLASPDSGRVHRANSIRGGGVLLVPTYPSLPPAWTPRDVVSASIPEDWPSTSAASAISRALSAHGLTSIADIPLRRLSAAAPWRAALAAANLAAPSLLLVDRAPADETAASHAQPAAAVAEISPAASACIRILRLGEAAPAGARPARLEQGRVTGLSSLPCVLGNAAPGAA